MSDTNKIDPERNKFAMFSADLAKIKVLNSSEAVKTELFMLLAAFYTCENGSNVTTEQAIGKFMGAPEKILSTMTNKEFIVSQKDYSTLAFILKDKKFYRHV